MKKTVVNSNNAAPPIGPYSHAVIAGGLLFTSGQIPLDADGNMAGDNIEVQTEQVFANIGAILGEAGLTFADVVKTTVYLKDMGDFAAMNAVYAKYFAENPPARSAVQAAALPKGSLVEIETVACLR